MLKQIKRGSQKPRNRTRRTLIREVYLDLSESLSHRYDPKNTLIKIPIRIPIKGYLYKPTKKEALQDGNGTERSQNKSFERSI